MIRQESAFTSDAVSHAGAYGFMQIMPKTGSMLEQTLKLDDHRSPVNNLKAGIYYYAMLVGRFMVQEIQININSPSHLIMQVPVT